MDLILWRHADAENGIPDETRKLTGKGLKQAERMATWLAARLPEGVIVLASPARRAQQTARALTRDFETRSELGPASTPQKVLAAAGWGDGPGAVVVVGHQPTLGQVAALVLTGSPAEWRVKKGAIWWLEQRERDGEAGVRAVISPDLLAER